MDKEVRTCMRSFVCAYSKRYVRINISIGKSALPEFSPISVTTFRMGLGQQPLYWIACMFCKQEHVNHKDMLKIFFASLFALVFNQRSVYLRTFYDFSY